MKITDITPQKHNKGRVSIFADGKYAFSMDEVDCVLNKLKIGADISEEDIQRLSIEANHSKAMSKAMDILSRKPVSARDLVNKLAEKGYDKEVAQSVVDEMEELGYIDDEAYARLYVEYAAEKHYGASKIRYELGHHGVASDIISLVLEESGDADIEELASLVLQKYGNCDFDDIRQRQRVTRFLASRGYSFDDINDVIRYCKKNGEI
ncbi:MAG: regulatory protein RecX [Clostridia bacterium]|nr:regulatory protein RecX [Clostridia bacterium]